MKRGGGAPALDDLWARHGAEWRSTAQIASQWREAAALDPRLLAQRVRGPWWALLERLGITLFVTREYEHLVMAYGARRRTSYLPLPHPSGIAADRDRAILHVASTRNPNQLYAFAPVRALDRREDLPAPASVPDRPLVPVRSTFLPGSLYIHDLAVIGGRLHANAVGQNAVIALDDAGGYERVWWPRSIDGARGPRVGRNYLQLNSIAAGRTLADSFFSASGAAPGRRRPGQLDYPVDGRGVVFSGRTREPLCAGLTRPHSARLHRGKLWVDNSGYGEVGVVEGGKFEPIARLPGWTRGLCFAGNVVFVGTSRVIPRFARYAPGLRGRTICGVHALDPRTGKVLAAVEWPNGNQVFGIDWLPARDTAGFPFVAGRAPGRREHALFYAYAPRASHKEKFR